MNKKFLVILAVIVAAGGFWLLTRPAQDGGTNGSGGETTNHAYGNNSKNVELIEYGDFQCPACGRYYPVIKQIKEKYKDDIKFVFRNFPLDSIHPNARAAHRAAEAASNQDKFWEMHDKLYETQQVWTNDTNPYDTFKTYAQDLGIDMARFDTDYKSEAVNKAINNDIKAGQAIKAASTPTFVLNGKKIDDETMQAIRFNEGLQAAVDDFSKLIDEAIAEKNPGAANASPSPAADGAASAPSATPTGTPAGDNGMAPLPSPEASATPTPQ